ncbi:MAG: HAD-IIA family hydrolase, partial [Desulfomonilaceae bacterium]
GASAFVVGEQPLVAGVEAAGVRVQRGGDGADMVIVAMDADFHYKKLNAAFQCLQRGALFWATNLDPTFPAEQGFVPGAGAIVAAIAAAIGRPPDRVFGKPQKDMALLALKRLDLSPHECLVVGDRMDTDVLFACNAGMDSALVLTGATRREHLSKYDFKPDYVFDDITGVEELFGEVAT